MAKENNSRIHPLLAFLDTLREAATLVDLVAYLEESKAPQIIRRKRAINHSVVIAICASFETFIEAVVEDALQCLLANATGSKQIPKNVLVRISTRLIALKDDISIWKISDNGWKREVLQNYAVLIEKFNTPRPDRIDEFISQTIGIRKISALWKWRGQSASASVKKLNEFMDLRGDITHRRQPNRKVYQHLLKNYANFLYRISTIMSNEVRLHVFNQVGKYPWHHSDLKDVFK